MSRVSQATRAFEEKSHASEMNHNPYDAWNIYLDLPSKSTVHVSKYTNPMDPLGNINPKGASVELCWVAK